MRTKRFLLVTAALATAACGKNPAVNTDAETLPLPANPKGSRYDDGDAEAVQPPPPPPLPPDAGPAAKNPPPPPFDAGPGGPVKPHPLPANPKGSHYDAGKKKGTDTGF